MRQLATTALVTVTLLCTTVLFSPQVRAQDKADAVTLTPAEQQQLDFLHQPEDWFIAHLKGPRETSEGGVLDARLQYVLENVTRPAAAMQPAIRAAYQTPEGRTNGRKALDRYWLIRTAPSEAMKSVEDRMLKGRDGVDIPVRIYHPNWKGTLPVLVYYHGGGFMFGSVEAWDRTAREIAAQTNMIVISVDYRLAPERPYPAAWNDAEDAYRWALANAGSLGGKTDAVAVGGDSAGGTLAVAVALRAVKTHQQVPAGMLLYYPGVDRVGDYASMKTFGTGYALDADNLKYLAGLVYPEGTATTQADTSPMQADLCGVPPAVIATAGFDPLQDSQKAFAAKLKLNAYTVDAYHYPSLIHGFQQTSGYVPDAQRATDEPAQHFGAYMRLWHNRVAKCP